MTTKTPHKWQKEIIAWANGAAIEGRGGTSDWHLVTNPMWITDNDVEYRIKPEPVIFNVYHPVGSSNRSAFLAGGRDDLWASRNSATYKLVGTYEEMPK